MVKRWRINKRDGRWCVYDRGILWDGFDTLADAHTAATQNAVADDLYKPGGLTCLATLKNRERQWILAGYNAQQPLAKWEEELVYYHQAARVE